MEYLGGGFVTPAENKASLFLHLQYFYRVKQTMSWFYFYTVVSLSLFCFYLTVGGNGKSTFPKMSNNSLNHFGLMKVSQSIPPPADNDIVTLIVSTRGFFFFSKPPDKPVIMVMTASRLTEGCSLLEDNETAVIVQ